MKISTKLTGLVCAGMLLMTGSCSTSQKKKTDPMEKKIDSLISQMTLEEKVGMIHASSSFTSGGVERLGIPEWVMSDGPHGVRMEHGRDWTLDNAGNDSATYLPTGITLASTWNPNLGYKFGTVLGSEANYRGKDVILGPGICIIRTPLNGRNFEYMTEDPYLNGQMAVQYIKGVQSEDVAACVKHYLANNQETNRFTVDVQMSERALREIYLPGFKTAVEEGGAYTLMGAYNKFRGQYCCENKYLLEDILKGEIGFKGAVISDWGAVHNTMAAVENGCDVEMGTDLAMMPNPDYGKFFMGDTVVTLVKEGKLDESLINDKVRRILRVMYKTHILGGERKKGSFNTPEHQEVALKVAEEGIVLLKNENVLPLDLTKIKTLAVIGANADRKFGGLGGSSQVRAKFEITPLQGLKDLVGNDVKINYVRGYKIGKEGKADPEMIKEAVAAAKKADAVVLVGGFIHGFSTDWGDNAYDAEGTDKPDMMLPFGQNDLISAVAKANPKTVVALIGGGPCDMTAWVDQTKAIVQAWYPGMEGGKALAEILFGNVNPSGKLPVTFPKKLEDTPVSKFGEYPGDSVVNYEEGIYVGYRYYDSYKVEPQFCFGHGLSYTKFTYSGLNLTVDDSGATVKLTLQNSGKTAGAEVVQVYVHDVLSKVKRPEKELKGFKKVFLQPGESHEIEVKLPASAFKYYDETIKGWQLEPGDFTIEVGSSSRDIRLKDNIKM
ncbi:MAG TPA: glycoside hydrolase family 3 C-terminal domain-containing protein [Bacteroidales bacterium]|nr:glycoside hydrolase family 3 C-terminal domain-containing protein [Bacteroidales bacterium]